MIEAAEQSQNRRESGRPASRARVSVLAVEVFVFLVVLWGGYGNHWSWTGINGRTATLWDWLHLLLLPLLLPTVVPALMPIATAGMTVLDQSEPGAEPAAEPGAEPGNAETARPVQSPTQAPAAGSWVDSARFDTHN